MPAAENATPSNEESNGAANAANIRDRLSSLEQDGQRFARKIVEGVEQRIPEQSKKAIDDLMVRARRTREGIERRVDESLDKTLGALNIPTRGQIEQLDRRLSDLSKRVNALSKTRPPAKRATSTRKRSPRTARTAS